MSEGSDDDDKETKSLMDDEEGLMTTKLKEEDVPPEEKEETDDTLDATSLTKLGEEETMMKVLTVDAAEEEDVAASFSRFHKSMRRLICFDDVIDLDVMFTFIILLLLHSTACVEGSSERIYSHKFALDETAERPLKKPFLICCCSLLLLLFVLVLLSSTIK